jgi:hypothetical protein
MMNDMPNFRTEVKNLAQEGAKTAYDEAYKASASGVDSTSTFQTNWTEFNVGKDNEDWHLALGSFSYSVSGKVTVSKSGLASLQYIASIFDRYNWELNTTFTIPRLSVEIAGHKFVPTLTGEQLGSLNKVGLARVYNVRGSSAVQTIDSYQPHGLTVPALPGPRSCKTTGDGVRYRTCPNTTQSCPAMGQYPIGTLVDFTCQTTGEQINGNWNTKYDHQQILEHIHI